MTLSSFPQSFASEKQARDEAVIWSGRFKEYLFFVIFNNTGKYIVDVVGNPYSDEQLLATYYNGELQ